jgi:hypothetical protein
MVRRTREIVDNIGHTLGSLDKRREERKVGQETKEEVKVCDKISEQKKSSRDFSSVRQVGGRRSEIELIELLLFGDSRM